MQTLASQLDVPTGRVSALEFALPLATLFDLNPGIAIAFALNLELPICSPTGLRIAFELEIALDSSSARSSVYSSVLERTEAVQIRTSFLTALRPL